MAVEKESKPRISKEKEALIKTVEGLGISTEGLSTEELLKKVVGELSKTNDKLVTNLVDKEIDALKSYSQSVEHNLKNQELLRRLMNLSVPYFYLHLFRDADMELDDSGLWEIVNESGINPFVEVQDLFHVKKSFAPPKKKQRRRG